MATRRRRPTRGTPYQPFQIATTPPAGFYDPAIDAQQAAATRGLEDLRADTGTAGTRAQDDFYLAQQQAGQQKTWGLADILTARRRGEEDYSQATAGLNRSYGILANNQRQAGNQAGLSGGGFAAQAARKRAENQGWDQQGLDRSIGRIREDSAQNESRFTTSSDSALAQLALGYGRGVEDRSQGLARGERENQFFSSDLGQQRFFQAQQAGYVPPEKQRNEGTRNGVTYRRVGNGFKLPDGRVVDRKTLLAMIAKGGG